MNFNLPKGYKLCVRVHQEEGGDLTHIIASKIVGEQLKYFLFKIGADGMCEQISSAITPTKFDKIIWPDKASNK